jgi:hypothetical protein
LPLKVKWFYTDVMVSNLKVFSMLGGLIFTAFTAWWILLRLDKAPEILSGDNFSDTYGILALVGGLAGVVIARQWGGFRSYMGRAVLAFAAGLLFQALGQFVYSYYFWFLNQEAPYPSWGDVGYFGSVLLYIYGTYCLIKVSGARLSMGLFRNKLMALFLPAALLAASYYFFLKDYEADWSAPLVTFLDFGYPLGQAFYIALALLTFMLSRKILGGIMRRRVLLLIAALVVQYAADFMFLYRFNRDQWYAGDPSDYTYLVAYFLMTMALLSIGKASREIKG